MPHSEFVLKSKAQADKVLQEFVERYGTEVGNAKFQEVSARSPKYSDLPDKVVTSFHHKIKRPNISRKYGKSWRGA